jgi:hypothetical protein
LNTTFGTLDILLNPDPGEVNGILNLTMSYSDGLLGNDTAVCILTGEEVQLSIFVSLLVRVLWDCGFISDTDPV